MFQKGAPNGSYKLDVGLRALTSLVRSGDLQVPPLMVRFIYTYKYHKFYMNDATQTEVPVWKNVNHLSACMFTTIVTLLDERKCCKTGG